MSNLLFFALRTSGDSVCSGKSLLGMKVFPSTYCYNNPQISPPATYNCDGTVTLYTGTTCQTTKLSSIAATNALDTCLNAINSKGNSIDYTCNNKAAVLSPTSWITITSYNDNTCSKGSTAWVSYACGVCVPAGNGVYYQFTCSQTGSTITYNFANYSTSTCSSSSLIYSQTSNVMTANSCVVRNVNANSVESSDLNYPYYGHAVYALVTSSTPPSAPYSGYLKK